jgi:predicted ester cyclase
VLINIVRFLFFLFIFQPINMLNYGKFQKMDSFTIYDRTTQRQYPGKLFYFDRLLVYTESVDSRLEYRGHYLGEEFGICDYDANKKFCLFAKKLGVREVEFWASLQQLENWYNMLHKSLMDSANAGLFVR